MASWKVTLTASACFCFAIANAAAATTRFAVLGDFGDVIRGSDKPLLQVQTVADLINRWEVDCIVTVGDNFYEYIVTTPPALVPIMLDRDIGQYYRQYIGAYQGAYGPGSTRNRMFLSPGNHDWGNETNNSAGLDAYLAYFTLPGAGISSPGSSGNERYFDCIQGNVHFFLLDSDDSEKDPTLAGNTWDSTQGNWLKNALANSKTTYPNLWRVILFHHPPFSSDYGSQRPHMRWPFRVWGADLVFHGHAHHYERLTFDGIFYVTEGTGGSSVSASFGTTSSQSITSSQNGSDFGATLVEATETALTLTHYNSGYARTTQTWDTVTIVRNSVDGVLDRLVGRASDDAEETTSTFIVSEPVLDLANNNAVTDKMTTGLRFTNVFIPQGATITRAFVQFKATNAGTATPNPVLTIKGHKVADSPTFDAANKVISRYDSQATTASATWTVLSWAGSAAGPNQRSPELASIIQEITSQGTWVSGNALTILLRKTTAGGNRWAHGFESAPHDGDSIQRQSGPPILHVEWSNPLPLVNVGAKDADAAEIDSSDTASFTISRTGPTTSALAVNYAFSGAVGDYTVLPPATLTSVSIPAGSSSVHVTNRANADSTVEMPFETLTLTLSPVAGSYNVGPAGSAAVAIHDIRPPWGLKAASENNQATLTWKPVSGATAYKVWRSTVSGSYSTPLQTVTTTNFTDTGVNNATTYYYVITSAKDSSDSVYSREVDVTPLAPVQNLSLTPGSGQQTLNWTPVAGAEWYHISRGAFTYTTNFRATAPPFTDTSSGAGYFYTVTPIKGGSEGPVDYTISSGLGWPAGVKTSPWAMVYLRAGPSPAPFPSVAIDSDLTTHAYSIYAPVSGATVSIVSGFVSSEDVLDFTTLGNITGSYANGTLTLSGSGYPSDYQAALRTVRYRNLKRTDATNPGPNNGTRVVRFIMNEGAFPGDPAYRQIRVKSSNTAPLLTSVNTLNGMEDTPLTISYAALHGAAVGASDVNVDTLQFRVGTVNSGSLAKNGVLVTANITTLGPGETWVWTPPINARGAQSAFTVSAYDGWSASSPARQVTVNLAATVFSIAATDPVALEYGTGGAFTISRSGGIGEHVTVNLLAGGTATVLDDYYPLPETVEFWPEVSSITLWVYLYTPGGYEPDETITATLTSNPNYLIGNSFATITIYSYAKLLPLSGDSSSAAYTMGNYGEIVGISSAAGSRAVSWVVPSHAESPEAAPTLVPVPATLVNNTVASARGAYKTIGWGNNSSGNIVAFYYDDTVPTSGELPGLTHPNRKALAITRDDAWAGGLAHVDAANFHACLWDFSVTPPFIMDLGTYSDDPSSTVNDLNNWTWFAIVGDSYGAAGTTPVLWRDFWSLAEALPIPGPDNNGSAQGINDNDKIVGYTWVNGSTTTRAVRWDSDGFSYTPSVLPLPLSAPEGASARALKINNNNVIVGYASHGTFTGGNRAVVWIDGTGYFLNDIAASPNINYTIAYDIHDNGRIVGQMLNNGSPQGFMLVQ
jgi:hypothetical protein